MKTLWVAEGFTDYYADVLVRRAGLTTLDEYFDTLSGQIEAVQTRPGRLVTAVEMASYDTWIKQYRPDEEHVEHHDRLLPQGRGHCVTPRPEDPEGGGGTKTLDDAMQVALQRHGGAKGYTPQQFYQVMAEVAGVDLKPFFARAVESTDELDYTEALDYYGLRFRPVDPRSARAFLGATTRVDNGRLLVTGLGRDTPAYEAGLNTDDEILAVDGVRVRADALATRLEQYRPGDRVQVLVARRDKLTPIEEE